MTLKEYQQDVVDEFVTWHNCLKKAKESADKIKSELKGSNIKDEAVLAQLHTSARVDLEEVWQKYKADNHAAYSDRVGPDGKSIPHVCIKVPTGGGKTRIAGAILKAIGKKRGLVLWIVPSNAIMEQTVNILKDKGHPIRQMLDIVSGNSVEVLKKDEQLSKYKLRDNLCVMLLMQQSANRVDGEFLKIRRNNGMYAEFFPPTDDKRSAKKLLKDHPGLDMISGTDIPRSSLVNVFRMLKPTVILDEAHKASNANFGKWAEFVNRLGPGLIIELSATPNESQSNILKVVTGSELRAESMIKSHILVNTTKSNWQGALKHAVDRLKNLESDANRYGKNYIRPIMVIRTELTDPDLHGTRHAKVHAFDARDHLVNTLGIPPEQVAIKSSTIDELRGEKLMERSSHIRYIITKNALMEGWDCPFAYVLVILDNLTSQRALIQLLGRVMRQPYTQYTGRDSLDYCYVHCISDDVDRVIRIIQKQLDSEGFTGMRGYVTQQKAPKRVNRRREGHSVDIGLPMVMYKDGNGWSDIDYDKHILYQVPWDDIAVKMPMSMDGLERGSEVRINTVTGGYEFVTMDVAGRRPKLSEWVAAISDLVPNAWQAARIATTFWANTGLPDDVIYANEARLQEVLLDELKHRITAECGAIFKDKLDSDMLRFDLHAPSAVFQMRGEYEIQPEDGDLLKTRDAEPVQSSLFKPVFEQDFDSNSERDFAKYLDEAEAIEWWHRVAARGQSEYYLRGWREHRIYPDFIALFNKDNERVLRIYEIKGSHLDNDDTAYKKEVLKVLEDAFNRGTLSVADGNIRGEFMILFDNEIEHHRRSSLKRGAKAKAGDFPPR